MSVTHASTLAKRYGSIAPKPWHSFPNAFANFSFTLVVRSEVIACLDRDAFRSLAFSLHHMVSKWHQFRGGGSILSKSHSIKFAKDRCLFLRCQMSFKRLIPAMAQRRTGLSDCTAANQRQPDTRHVLSREQAIQVYDRQVKCADQIKILRFFGLCRAHTQAHAVQSRSRHQGQQQCVRR